MCRKVCWKERMRERWMYKDDTGAVADLTSACHVAEAIGGEGCGGLAADYVEAQISGCL